MGQSGWTPETLNMPSTDATSPTKQLSPFERLLGELRNRVYEAVIQNKDIVFLGVEITDSFEVVTFPLARTCRLFRSEFKAPGDAAGRQFIKDAKHIDVNIHLQHCRSMRNFRRAQLGRLRLSADHLHFKIHSPENSSSEEFKGHVADWLAAIGDHLAVRGVRSTFEFPDLSDSLTDTWQRFDELHIFWYMHAGSKTKISYRDVKQKAAAAFEEAQHDAMGELQVKRRSLVAKTRESLLARS